MTVKANEEAVARHAHRWKLAGLWGPAAALALAGSCVDDRDPIDLDDYGIEVDAAYAPDAEFEQYRTFAFQDADELDEELLDDLQDGAREDLERVNSEVAHELRDIGLEEVDADEADLHVFSLARTSGATRLQWDCVPSGWGGYWYWGYYYDPCAWLERDYVSVETTTVIVGLVAPAREEVVFVGFIHGVDETGTLRDEEIEIGVSRVFERYPASPAHDGGAEPDGGVDARAPDGGTDPGEGSDAGEAVDGGDEPDASEDGSAEADAE